MRCLFCQSDTSVEISRPSRKSSAVWRRRQCNACYKAFSTREKPDLSLSVTVKKPSGQNEPFSEDKLLISVYDCLSHRKDALEASRALIDTIVRLILPVKTVEVSSIEIRTVVLKVLKHFDKAAYTYYQAHHIIS
ncbi:MAG TPA: hypothetical protein VD947_03575 [Patescibacteria group bacterium]|nr:hypothetical protein [Patescibacteria group bacterium]